MIPKLRNWQYLQREWGILSDLSMAFVKVWLKNKRQNSTTGIIKICKNCTKIKPAKTARRQSMATPMCCHWSLFVTLTNLSNMVVHIDILFRNHQQSEKMAEISGPRGRKSALVGQLQSPKGQSPGRTFDLWWEMWFVWSSQSLNRSRQYQRYDTLNGGHINENL